MLFVLSVRFSSSLFFSFPNNSVPQLTIIMTRSDVIKDGFHIGCDACVQIPKGEKDNNDTIKFEKQ